MSRIVKAALLQDRLERRQGIDDRQARGSPPREAAGQGAQIICFQGTVSTAPYFCQVQDAEYYEYTEYIPDGPHHQAVPGVGQGN